MHEVKTLFFKLKLLTQAYVGQGINRSSAGKRYSIKSMRCLDLILVMPNDSPATPARVPLVRVEIHPLNVMALS